MGYFAVYQLLRSFCWMGLVDLHEKIVGEITELLKRMVYEVKKSETY